MKYEDYLKTLTECPFCSRTKPRILVENEYAILTYSRAPYHKYHLIVVPKRHVEHIKDLLWDENICIMALVVNAIKVLDKIGHDDCTIVARDGRALGKSIEHLHYHIIPGGVIEDTSINQEVRKLLSETEEANLRDELNNLIEQ